MAGELKTAALLGLLVASGLAGCAAQDGAGTPAPLLPSDVPPTPENEDVARHLARFVTGDEWRLGSQWRLEAVTQRLDGRVPRPWTVERLAAYAASSLDAQELADLVYLLAASKSPLGLRVAGLSLDHADLKVRTAATAGIAMYWIEFDIAGGTEQVMDAARAFWESRRDRLRHLR